MLIKAYSKIYARVNEFFFKEEHYATIGLLRILASAVILLMLINDLPLAVDYFSDDGFLSGHTELMRSEYRFSILDYAKEPSQVLIVYGLLMLSALMLLLGKFTRLSAIATFILLASFHERNPFILDSAETLMRLMVFYLALAPSGKYFSLDAAKKGKVLSPEEMKKWQNGPIWPRRLMQLQLAIVYLFAFLAKTGATWKDGTAVYYFLTNSHFARFNFEFLGNFMPLVQFMTYSALAIELLFPILVWFMPIRPYINAAGIILQLSILFSSNIVFFSLIMIAAHMAFIEPETVNKAVNKLEGIGKLIKNKVE
mgnify:CR=1 FL=1